MPGQLPFAHAEHAAVGKHGGADFLDALVDVEEHDEEHQRHAERDLGPDAEAEPQRKDRRQHHARQRIGHLDIGIEHRGNPRLACEPEADRHAADRADGEGEYRFPQRDQKMFPDHATGEPVDDLAADIDRIGKEERRQQDAAEHRHGGEQLPHRQRNHGDQYLAEQQDGPAHHAAPIGACEACA